MRPIYTLPEICPRYGLLTPLRVGRVHEGVERVENARCTCQRTLSKKKQKNKNPLQELQRSVRSSRRLQIGTRKATIGRLQSWTGSRRLIRARLKRLQPSM